MKQTAVEWLMEIQNSQKGMLFECDINQAKEMEKQQIIDAGNSCALKQHLHIDKMIKMSESEIIQFAEKEHLTFGEQYYKETFNK
jgi:hypothetical protein